MNEGIGDTIKRGVKQVKRGMQGWGGAHGKPGEIVKRNKGHDDKTIKNLDLKGKIYKDVDGPAPAHSPQALQNRVVDREMKKRGLGEEEHKFGHEFAAFKNQLEKKHGPGNVKYQGDGNVTDAYHVKTGKHLGFIDGQHAEISEGPANDRLKAHAGAMVDKLKNAGKKLVAPVKDPILDQMKAITDTANKRAHDAQNKKYAPSKKTDEAIIPDGPNDKWGKDMPSFGYNPEEEKKDSKFFKQAFAAPKFGVFRRGGAIGDKAPHAIKTFDSKEEALAMCKRYNNLLSPGEKEYYGLKYVVRNVPAEAMDEADKHSFVGKIQRGHELKKKVDSTYKDIGAAQQKGDHPEASKAFRKHERYANLERPGTWTKVKEAMPAAVATATQKMNPGAAAPAPVAGTSSPSAPGAPSAPKVPGSVGAVDPAIAKAQQSAYQKNIAKLGLKNVNAAQAGVSMQKQADDMQMNPTDNTNNAKIAGTLANVLKDPAGAQQLKTLTDKFAKKPGMQ
jgi:hypothetical protein